MTFFRRLLNRARLAYPHCSEAYRRWAGQRALRLREDENGASHLSGRLHGRDVTIDVADWIDLTVAVALPSAKPLLMTRATKPIDSASACIGALFADSVLRPELRVITINARHLKLRFVPTLSPFVLDHAVERVAEAMRAIHAAPESEPRHSCITATATTVPYPT